MAKLSEIMDSLYERKSQPSITLSRSIKGVYSWDIKIYAEDITDLPNKLSQIDSELREKFGASQKEAEIT